ncbi:hypothetical protein [Microvirga sp. VF16]|uniref:hypothetical protein n=1 Tax=Microvirga sp. VF16 TaxID=2807101 RepID=UPI00193CAD1F|nr:hypothetical protein [Microvirga sp. VF16]QRM32979.1 hypothetical protein JO965_27005 [Microvirga sp. VF16]
MTYRLIQLAPGAFDLLLHDTVIASVVRNGSRQPYAWTAELLEDLPRSKRPSPFREIEHDFSSLEEVCAWLGHPRVKTNNRHGAAQSSTRGL